MREKKPNLEEMLSKFISVSETRFQNTETALKNQQALIQGLETQIGQLSKLISERPQGSLPSNTELTPREQLNAINVQDEEGFVEPEPEPRQEAVVSRDQGDEMSLKEVHEPFPNNRREPIHEDQRLQIEELDEWWMHKPRLHDKPKLCQNKLNTFPNQLKVGDKVLLDAADPHIATTKPNEEIPFTVLNIFLFGTVEVTNRVFDHRLPTPHGQSHSRVTTTEEKTTVRYGLVKISYKGKLLNMI
ncbi:hypothetical protein GOBAR_AA27093 [Gossypium barbadense]|uniref:Uncharacterized protein n=1 Tax=Gossypium barbadense TaxID=3634 RepID=A0A2P5WR50_GOSBA|nr:hypothetical protein GOBAR_AA27093 [Gossypium barbadense]